MTLSTYRPLLCFATAAALSAPAAAASDTQLWTIGGVNVTLAPKWRLSEELVGRFSHNRDGLYEMEATSLLGYRLSKSVTIAGGYVYNPQYSRGDRTATESRFREQITVDNFVKLGTGKFSARMRAEQRWRNNVGGTGWRLRPYLKYSVPLVGKASLNLSNETFVNLNTTAFQKTSGIDRMRNLVSLTAPLSKRLTVEGGYMNQHGFVRNGSDTSDNVAYFGMTLNL